MCSLKVLFILVLVLLHGDGPEMNVFLMCCLVDADGVGKRGVLLVGCGYVHTGTGFCILLLWLLCSLWWCL